MDSLIAGIDKIMEEIKATPWSKHMSRSYSEYMANRMETLLAAFRGGYWFNDEVDTFITCCSMFNVCLFGRASLLRYRLQLLLSHYFLLVEFSELLCFLRYQDFMSNESKHVYIPSMLWEFSVNARTYKEGDSETVAPPEDWNKMLKGVLDPRFKRLLTCKEDVSRVRVIAAWRNWELPAREKFKLEYASLESTT